MALLPRINDEIKIEIKRITSLTKKPTWKGGLLLFSYATQVSREEPKYDYVSLSRLNLGDVTDITGGCCCL